MKRIPAVLALLFAAPLVAQPYVGEEVRSWTMETPMAVSSSPSAAVALVADGGQFVIGWSAGLAQSRISVAKLDGSLRVIDGTQRELPAYSGDGFDAGAPQLAVMPDGYALAWLERQRSTLAPVRIIVARLSKSLDIESEVLVNSISRTARMRLGTKADGTILIASDPVIYTVEPTGATSFGGISGGTLDDAVMTPQEIAYVSHTFTPAAGCGFICLGASARYVGRVYIDDEWADTTTLSGGSVTQPDAIGINDDGRTNLVTWVNGGTVFATHEVLPRLPYPESFDHPLPLGTTSDTAPFLSVPSAAGDREHWLVVWQSKGKIVGSAIDDRVRPIAIATGERPLIVNVAKGVFVVAYEVIIDDTHRQLAGRYITFIPPHTRPGAK